MKNPFRRTPARDPRVESALRHSLAEHARQAPAGEDVTDRVLAAVEGTRAAPDPYRGPSRWRAWTLPLVAAGSVAAVVGVVAGIQQLDQPTHRPSALTTHSPSVPQSVTPTVPGPTTSAPSLPTSKTSTPVDTSSLHNVKILDLTFAGLDDGWALATADCIRGTGRCAALLRTRDGSHWQSSPRIGFNVVGQTAACTVPCVQHLRFATDRIGYAYGPNTLMMTIDAGRHWSEQTGGALFLETLNQNVIRVTSPHPGCPGWCDVRVQTADLGSSSWTTRLGPITGPAWVQFARGGDDAYLLFTGHSSGGSGAAASTLYRSPDNGATWQQGGEPCPQISPEDDSYAIAGGDAGRVSVLCTHRGPLPAHQVFLATSTDHGANFTAQPGNPPRAAVLTGDPATVLVNAGGGRLSRSTDGGQSWSPVPYPISRVSFAGFESSQVGRVVAADGTEIWTTRDGGNSWTKVLFN